MKGNMMNVEQVRYLSAYLYLMLGERMPATILDENGEIDIEADNAVLEEWSNMPFNSAILYDDVSNFIRETDALMNELLRLYGQGSAEYIRACYDAAKRTFGDQRSSIRQYFQWLYTIMFGYPNGPRWGDFIEIYGVGDFIDLYYERLESVFDRVEAGDL